MDLKPDEYYWEGSLLVLTAKYHLRKGKCCDNGCRHCPYKGLKPDFIEIDEANEF